MVAVRADDALQLLSRIADRLAQPAVVRARFVQEKRLAALSRPVVSRGRLTIARGDGVLWRLETPIRMSIAITETGIVETDSEGTRRARTARDNPALAEIGRVFRGVFTADLSSLRQYFELRVTGDLDRWHVDLAPRSAEVGRFIRTMQLSGGRHIETIRVEEPGGDYMVIRLSGVVTASTIDVRERGLLTAP